MNKKTKKRKRPEKRCSFCGEGVAHVHGMVTSDKHNVYICDLCVAVSLQLLCNAETVSPHVVGAILGNITVGKR